MQSESAPLTRVAVYERSIGARIERVWENVHDWEHLPWLHASSFRSIELVDRGDWGWKARIGLHPEAGPEILLELVLENDRRYVSRTLEGAGAGTEIWTTLAPVSPERTDITVEFLVPGVDPAAATAIGVGFTALYARLWDEDEAMMRQRTAMLGLQAAPAREGLDLGDETEVRRRAPFTVEHAGRRIRVAVQDDVLIAYSAVCPHWLGPLDAARLENGELTCPWHGYRFDVRSGRRRDEPSSRMRLAPVPSLIVDPVSKRVHFEARSG